MVRINFAGDEIDKVEMFEKVKEIMIDFLRGYPAYIYWGIIEGRFEGNLGEIVRERLAQDGIIEYIGMDSEKKPVYRLTPKGVDFAVSFRNLNYSKEVFKQSQETHYFTKIIIWLTYILVLMTFGLFIFAFIQSVISLWF